MDTKPRQTGFWALVLTQFQGAFSDNLFKWLMLFWLIRGLSADTMDAVRDDTISWAFLLFSLPFLLFPAFAGGLADRFSKRRVIIWTKCWELGVMTLGAVGFYTNQPWLLWVALFLMAMQSAFFNPAKYGILPEILSEQRLSWGNGIIQMGTFVAIIAGTALAPVFSQYGHGQPHLAALPLIAFSLMGLGSAVFVSRVPAAKPKLRLPINPWHGLWGHLKTIGRQRTLILPTLGITYLWFSGVLCQQAIIRLGNMDLGLSDMRTGSLQVALALGIGIGSLAAGWLSRGKVETGLVPPGAVGLTVGALLLGWMTPTYTSSMVLLFFMGASAGLYTVPLNALLQQRSPRDQRGEILATVNWVTFGGMLLAALLFGGLTELNFSTQQIFLCVSVLSLVATAYIIYLLPFALVRMVFWVLGNSIYKLRVKGSEHVPETGGALLVSNHMSYIDAQVIVASIDRDIRFMMGRHMYDMPWIKPLAKLAKAIPVSATAGPRDIIASLRTAKEALENGELVCIFAEGQISRTGQTLSFRKGLEKIAKGTGAPIIPVHLDRLWGSIFSFEGGRFFWKIPEHIPYPISVRFGEPLPTDASATTVRQAVLELSAEAHFDRKPQHKPLHRQFIHRARRHPFRKVMVDELRGELRYNTVLTGTVALARRLRTCVDDADMTGVLIPPSIGGALANAALTLMGKTPVNLNYTTSSDMVNTMIKRCGITQVVTSKKFLKKVPLELDVEMLFLEDLAKYIGTAQKTAAFFLGQFCPVRLLEHLVGGGRKRSMDDLVTVIFSSGSEGEPKGVMLSHFNISSNIESYCEVFPYEQLSPLLGVLPFFHSFGYTVGLWLSLLRGLKVVYHPNPLDARMIGKLAREHDISLLVATPTFLQYYTRRCDPSDFETLKTVVTGAEKLSDRVRDAFEEKFHKTILECYGTTECSPAIACSVPDFKAPGFYQPGSRKGAVGRPVPGMAVRVIDTDTGEKLPIGETGMLHVRGPNVMVGYLGMPEKTAAVLKDGWYETGDIVFIDDDGFIHITDRLARFSKLAGEMVSHGAVEEALHDLLDEKERVLVVCGVPDERKGERLSVLHTLDDDRLNKLLDAMKNSELPNLWQPKSSAFHRIDEIPLLGSGKIDMKAMKSIAMEKEGLS